MSLAPLPADDFAHLAMPHDVTSPESDARLRAAAVSAGPGANLIGADLRGCDLSGRDLRGAQLSGADLTGAVLVATDLSEACLADAKLLDADLSGANLSNARLSGVDATRAGFGHAKLVAASLFDGQFAEASFIGADLSRADLRRARAHQARFFEAKLTGANFERSELTEVELGHAIVTRASFRDANLRGARVRHMTDFETADFVHADIRDVDFSGAYQLRRHIVDQDFLDEFRHRSGYHGVLYWLWWVSSDCGRSILRWFAWVGVVAVLYAFAYSLTNVDVGTHDSPTTLLYYSVVTLTSLGYGDVIPRSSAAQLLAMSEVLVGYVLLGGLISIFSNKLARRGE